jgi:anaerobic ribonucleoside-triphosphate reductase activating protein
MKETTWIIDTASGALTVEGMSESELTRLADDLLAAPSHVNCARPVNVPPARRVRAKVGCDEPSLRVHRIYHGSVVEGPGRRSVLQLMGCTLRCPGCHTPETHRTDGGVLISVGEVVDLLLDPEGLPRDGVTVLGGEPFLQHKSLSLLLRDLKGRGQHITLYSGYTLEELRARPEPSVREALALADILIDGRFVASLSSGAGEWRGSTNQRVIYAPAEA